MYLRYVRKLSLTVLHDPSRSDLQAISNAMAVLEHAESSPILGPCRLKNQLSRFASRLKPKPTAAYVGGHSGSLVSCSM